MPRRWSHLIALVSLVAFLAANTHASLALGANRSAHTHSAESGIHCCHCGEATEIESDDAAEGCESPHYSPSTPCESNCPECPKGPCCPCPGGCAACNVAKVPCFFPSLGFGVAVACLGDCHQESPPLYTPPLAGRLVRPPRV